METYEISVELYDREKHSEEWLSEAEGHAGGICSVETWRDQDALFHRNDGPALIMRDTQSGETVAEVWYSHGKLHRDGDMPAAIWKTGFLRREWYQHGLLHRKGGPARLITTPDHLRELVFEQWWYLNGKAHRIGGPAHLMVSDETGVVMSEGWYQNGKRHRVDGPAIIVRNEETGVAYNESWLQYGQEYRTDGGPTFISRNEKTGEIRSIRGPPASQLIKSPSP